MRIKPGFGYWDTTRFPLGGAFRRAGDSGVEVVKIVRTFPRTHGADTEGESADGRKIAFDSANTDSGHAH